MSKVLERVPLGFPWQTFDPFLFCAYHLDGYPAGDERMAPVTGVAGRNIGSDFSRRDGWSMYHGDVVPGFPSHPHRGFETVTIARNGFIDHTDSMGAHARFGHGDVQWMTAGSGIVHAEMFPLVERERDNPTELFQVWLNLPRASKFVKSYFKMFWNEQIPQVLRRDEAGRETVVTLVAGTFGGAYALEPPPDSWAANPNGDVGIWTIKMAPGARFTVPAARPGVQRALYFFVGSSLRVDDQKLPVMTCARVQGDAEIPLVNGPEPGEILLLEGRPIGEPVVHYGPFVMNTADEIRDAFADYQRTRFGGWPWPAAGPTHPRDSERFAVHADGTRDTPV